MKTEHKPREIKKFLNDLIGAKKIDTDIFEFEYMLSPAEAYVKIKQFFELDGKEDESRKRYWNMYKLW